MEKEVSEASVSLKHLADQLSQLTLEVKTTSAISSHYQKGPPTNQKTALAAGTSLVPWTQDVEHMERWEGGAKTNDPMASAKDQTDSAKDPADPASFVNA